MPRSSYLSDDPEVEIDHSAKKKEGTGGMPVKFRANVDFGYSVSGQPDPSEYGVMFNELEQTSQIKPEEIHVVNLRLENHCYMNGQAVAFPENHEPQPGKELNDFLNDKKEAGTTVAFKNAQGAVEDVEVNSIQSEEDFLKDNGITQYNNIGVTDHGLPEPKEVNEFINILRERAAKSPIPPRRPWIHIHCHGGKGRSSLFAAILVLTELQLQNKLDPGKNLEEILKQHLDKDSYKKLFPSEEKKEQKDKDKDKTLVKHDSSDSDNTPDMIAQRQEFLGQFLTYLKNDFDAGREWPGLRHRSNSLGG